MKKVTIDKKVTIKAPESEPEIEKLKKIYRMIREVIVKHDSILKRKEKLEEIFHHDAILLRDRLMEYCEKLLLSAPIDLRLKVEDILWRKCFYLVIKHIRKAGKIVGSNLLNAYWLHLKSACGFYLQLMMRIQYEFNLRSHSDFNPALIPKPLQRCNRGGEDGSGASSDLHAWAANLVHKCLIYLGDLARYESDCFDRGQRVVAQRYYYQALAFNPHNGVIYNQLATLANHSNLNLNATYYYLRSLLSHVPFRESATNLLKLFEANRANWRHINDESQPQKNKEAKRLVVEFLMLINCLYSNQPSLDGKEVRQICESLMSNLNVCLAMRCQLGSRFDHGTKMQEMEIEAVGEEKKSVVMDTIRRQVSGELLDGDAVLRMLLILIAILHLNIHSRGSELGAGIAVGLVTFSHLLNYANIQLHSHLAAITTTFPPKESGDKCAPPPSSTPQLNQCRNNTKQKLSSLRRRGRGRGRGQGNSEESEEDEEDDSCTHTPSEPSSSLSQESLHSEGGLVAGELSNLSSQSEGRLSCEDSQLENGMVEEGQTEVSAVEVHSSGDALDEAINNLILPHNDNINCEDAGSQLAPQENKQVSSLAFDLSQYQNLNKEVSIPPGFESSVEMMEVAELSSKLANFDIDTDTDTQQCYTDLELDNNRDKVVVCVGVASGVDLLPSILVFSHWLTANPDVITNCAQASPNIWLRLSMLLNFFPTEKQLVTSPEMIALKSRLVEGSESIETRLFAVQLPEEIHLQHFLPIPDLPSTISNNNVHLSIRQQAVMRMWRLRRFGVKVCEINSLGLCYNHASQQFYYNKPQPISNRQAARANLNEANTVSGARLPLSTPKPSSTTLTPAPTSAVICHDATALNNWNNDDDAMVAPSKGGVPRANISIQSSNTMNSKVVFDEMVKTNDDNVSHHYLAAVASTNWSRGDDPTGHVLIADDGGGGTGRHVADSNALPDSQATNFVRDVDALETPGADRDALMRSMARLRLQSEVSRLEGKAAQRSQLACGFAFRPLIVVIDADLPAKHLTKLLALSNRHRFTIILANAVVAELDVLKKEEAEARDIIRVLEKQSERGHKWLRAQKKEETTNCFGSDHQTTDKHLLRLIELINCAQYFSDQQDASTRSANQKNPLTKPVNQEYPITKSTNQKDPFFVSINKNEPLFMPTKQQDSEQAELTKSSDEKAGPADEQVRMIDSTTDGMIIEEKKDCVVLLLSENSQLKLIQLPRFNAPSFDTQSPMQFISNFNTIY